MLAAWSFNPKRVIQSRRKPLDVQQGRQVKRCEKWVLWWGHRVAGYRWLFSNALAEGANDIDCDIDDDSPVM
jgi:hypothetical protein